MDNGACVGTGWVFQAFTGETLRPMLYDLKGEELASGSYVLNATDTQVLAIAPLRAQ